MNLAMPVTSQTDTHTQAQLPNKDLLWALDVQFENYNGSLRYI